MSPDERPRALHRLPAATPADSIVVPPPVSSKEPSGPSSSRDGSTLPSEVLMPPPPDPVAPSVANPVPLASETSQSLTSPSRNFKIRPASTAVKRFFPGDEEEEEQMPKFVPIQRTSQPPVSSSPASSRFVPAAAPTQPELTRAPTSVPVYVAEPSFTPTPTSASKLPQYPPPSSSVVHTPPASSQPPAAVHPPVGLASLPPKPQSSSAVSAIPASLSQILRTPTTPAVPSPLQTVAHEAPSSRRSSHAVDTASNAPHVGSSRSHSPSPRDAASSSTRAPSPARAATSSSGELYEIVSQVGEGTFGKVYKAKNTYTGMHVALKRIRMETEKDGFPVTAMREIKLLQSLRHENVIQLYEMMVSNGMHLLCASV